MFSAVSREHERRKQNLRDVYESETRAALAEVPKLAHTIVDLANVEVSRIYDLQLQIEAEARAVRAEATALERNLGDVAAAVRQVTDSLKLLGDFENYVLVLGERVDRVTSTLLERYQQQQQQHNNNSSSSSATIMATSEQHQQ